MTPQERQEWPAPPRLSQGKEAKRVKKRRKSLAPLPLNPIAHTGETHEKERVVQGEESCAESCCSAACEAKLSEMRVRLAKASSEIERLTFLLENAEQDNQLLMDLNAALQASLEESKAREVSHARCDGEGDCDGEGEVQDEQNDGCALCVSPRVCEYPVKAESSPLLVPTIHADEVSPPPPHLHAARPVTSAPSPRREEAPICEACRLSPPLSPAMQAGGSTTLPTELAGSELPGPDFPAVGAWLQRPMQLEGVEVQPTLQVGEEMLQSVVQVGVVDSPACFHAGGVEANSVIQAEQVGFLPLIGDGAAELKSAVVEPPAPIETGVLESTPVMPAAVLEPPPPVQAVHGASQPVAQASGVTPPQAEPTLATQAVRSKSHPPIEAGRVRRSRRRSGIGKDLLEHRRRESHGEVRACSSSPICSMT